MEYLWHCSIEDHVAVIQCISAIIGIFAHLFSYYIDDCSQAESEVHGTLVTALIARDTGKESRYVNIAEVQINVSGQTLSFRIYAIQINKSVQMWNNK